MPTLRMNRVPSAVSIGIDHCRGTYLAGVVAVAKAVAAHRFTVLAAHEARTRLTTHRGGQPIHTEWINRRASADYSLRHAMVLWAASGEPKFSKEWLSRAAGAFIGHVECYAFFDILLAFPTLQRVYCRS